VSLPRRPLGLSVLLVLLVVASAFGFYKVFTQRTEFFAEYPRLTPALWRCYLAIPALNLVSIAGLWSLRRWGYWLTCLILVLSLSIELYAMGLAPHVIRIPIVFGLISWFVIRSWKSFR